MSYEDSLNSRFIHSFDSCLEDRRFSLGINTATEKAWGSDKYKHEFYVLFSLGFWQIAIGFRI